MFRGGTQNTVRRSRLGAFAVFYLLMQLVEIRSRKCLAYFRHTFDAFFHTFGCLQHSSGRAAAAVSVAVADQDIVVDVLVLVAVPSAMMASGCSIPLYVVKKLVSGCPTPSVVII